MLITEGYRDLNRQLHETRPDYGISAGKWVGQVEKLAKNVRAGSILDYGCGKQILGQALSHLLVRSYDPAIPGLEASPEPADFVVCTDVLEHIEPECLDDVLDDLLRCTIKAIFLTVATRPAKKQLPDGRNTHLIQEPADWWLPKIMVRWEMRLFQAADGEFAIFALARHKEHEHEH